MRACVRADLLPDAARRVESGGAGAANPSKRESLPPAARSAAAAERVLRAVLRARSTQRALSARRAAVIPPRRRTLSRPTGPSEVLTMLAIAVTAVTFCVRTSAPDSRDPAICSLPPGIGIAMAALAPCAGLNEAFRLLKPFAAAGAL